MGVSGFQGAFVRACEATLRIMRQHWDTITPIIEVFLHDPLYRWIITLEKGGAVGAGGRDQDNTRGMSVSSTSSTDAADTAAFVDPREQEERLGRARLNVLRVRERLLGQEPREAATSSVEDVVKWLISEATASENLSQLFPGWMPYL